MITFGKATIVGEGSAKLIVIPAPGARALSLITQGVQCRDKGDGSSHYTSLSLDIDVELVGAGVENINVDVRGGDALAGSHAFGVLRVQIGGTKRTLTGGLESGEIYDRLTVSAIAPSNFRISVLLMANAGLDPAAESLISLDSLDLAFAA